ncbi:acyltransferase [Flavobacterium gyeonganense]|uniref:Acyltransferase n=1 Tax=Flavobacterium gyeonganense TaxID=1310418 RepID=A0ABV5HGC9_9FLAO|nr:acyltransferase [Flavobacterium gyeonganense]
MVEKVKKNVTILLRILSSCNSFLLSCLKKNLQINSTKSIFYAKVINKGNLKITINSSRIIKSNIFSDGNNNTIEFAEGVRIHNCKFIIIGSNCTIKIKGNRIIKNSKFELLDSNTSVVVGNNTGFNNNRILVAGLGNKIEIGNECIFAENAELWASDTHSILDVETNKRLNPDRPIIIENNVWICNRVLVMKGVTIGENSVIASGSIVTKDIDRNAIAAGIPATVIKRNIKWDIQRM